MMTFDQTSCYTYNNIFKLNENGHSVGATHLLAYKELVAY